MIYNNMDDNFKPPAGYYSDNLIRTVTGTFSFYTRSAYTNLKLLLPDYKPAVQPNCATWKSPRFKNDFPRLCPGDKYYKQ